MSSRALAAALSVLSLVGCSGASSGGPSSGAPTFEGVYESSAAGAIHILALAQGQYELIPSACAGASGSCDEAGTFSESADGTELLLTNAASGKITSLAISGLKTEDPTPSTASLSSSFVHTEGICIAGSPKCPLSSGSSGNGSDLGNGNQGLTSGGGSSLTTSSQSLTCQSNCVVSFGANGQVLSVTGSGITLTTGH